MAKKTYEPAPQVPLELRERYATMLEVLSGRITVSEGARRLGMSRNHFQTLMHRGLKGMAEGITPGTPGRPGKPQRETELERENEQLRRENERLRGRTEMIDRLLGVASGVIRGRVRSTRTRKSSKEGGGSEGDDPDGGLEIVMRVEAEGELRKAGLAAALSCAVVGASLATVRRWRRWVRLGAPAAVRSARTLAPELHERVASLVRALRGLIGAEALRHAVPGVSRRQAARVKSETLAEMERERMAATERITVTVPGVARGFDAMYVRTTAGVRYPLIAADAAIPFRTSAVPVEHYDEHAVAAVLEHDFAEHGPPLVLRADRWRAHDAPRVAEVLRSHGVLLLHGPPHHPGYYGQLERQNREHRAWLAAGAELHPDALSQACAEMRSALNCRWPRRSLGWRTSLEAWTARPVLDVDRAALCEEVQDRAARIRRQADGRAATAAMAERLAIEWALTKRGYLRREPGGWC